MRTPHCGTHIQTITEGHSSLTSYRAQTTSHLTQTHRRGCLRMQTSSLPHRTSPLSQMHSAAMPPGPPSTHSTRIIFPSSYHTTPKLTTGSHKTVTHIQTTEKQIGRHSRRKSKTHSAIFRHHQTSTSQTTYLSTPFSQQTSTTYHTEKYKTNINYFQKISGNSLNKETHSGSAITNTLTSLHLTHK